MKEGDKIQVVAGGYGKIAYLGRGQINYLFHSVTKLFKIVSGVDARYKRIGLIAAGTGLTPLF